MSLGLCPVCEPALDDARMPDGTALLQALDVLDELSAALGVRALSSYGDTRELPADFDGDPDEALELLGPRTDWHAINDGLASCETLLQSLARHPQADLDNALIDDLRELRDWLARAAATRRRFRLELV
jgi:hypothetical protein